MSNSERLIGAQKGDVLFRRTATTNTGQSTVKISRVVRVIYHSKESCLSKTGASKPLLYAPF